MYGSRVASLGLLTLAVCIKNLDEQIERIGRADVRQFIETFAVLKRFDNLKQFCFLFRSKCHNFLYLNRITDFPFCAENRIESVLTSLIAWGFRSEPTTLRSLLDRLINSDIIIPLPRFHNPNTRRSAPEWSLSAPMAETASGLQSLSTNGASEKTCSCQHRTFITTSIFAVSAFGRI